MSEYLTTKELADLLRIKERKVYDLAASGDVPCSRATGKLLFPRQAVEAWLAENGTGYTAAPNQPRPPIVLGSHDPLLDWALRESQCGLATIFDGSLDGLERFTSNEGAVAGLHIFDPLTNRWNLSEIENRFSGKNIVLIEWAKRERGLISQSSKKNEFQNIPDLKTARLAIRQQQAGSQKLLEHLLGQEKIQVEEIAVSPPARTETDAALLVRDAKADVAFGLAAPAKQFGLSFSPIVTERFDLLVDRKFWFEPQWQKFLVFCRSESFAQKANETPGYDVTGLGTVHLNG